MGKSYHELIYDMFLTNNPYYCDKVDGWDVHGKHIIRVRINDGTMLEYNGSSDSLRIVVDPIVKTDDGDVRRIFAHNLVKQMYSVGYTQQLLSEHTGISQPTISNYVKAISTPSLTAALKIAEVLRCDLNYLLGK